MKFNFLDEIINSLQNCYHLTKKIEFISLKLEVSQFFILNVGLHIENKLLQIL